MGRGGDGYGEIVRWGEESRRTIVGTIILHDFSRVHVRLLLLLYLVRIFVAMEWMACNLNPFGGWRVDYGSGVEGGGGL